jgi:hypothetical protein
MHKIGNINALSKVDYNNGHFRTVLPVIITVKHGFFAQPIAKNGDLAVRKSPFPVSSKPSIGRCWWLVCC